MNKAVRLATLLLLAPVTGVFAEVGIGLDFGCILPLAGRLGGDSEVILAGVNFRWKPSAFFLDAGFAVVLDAGVPYRFLDLGLCLDWRFLRFGLAVGLESEREENGYGRHWENGLNAKADLDFLLGRVSVGLSGSFPLGMLLPMEELNRIASRLSVSCLYWFGSRSRRR